MCAFQRPTRYAIAPTNSAAQDAPMNAAVGRCTCCAMTFLSARGVDRNSPEPSPTIRRARSLLVTGEARVGCSLLIDASPANAYAQVRGSVVDADGRRSRWDVYEE